MQQAYSCNGKINHISNCMLSVYLDLSKQMDNLWNNDASLTAKLTIILLQNEHLE
jgi:hypothetical protein